MNEGIILSDDDACEVFDSILKDKYTLLLVLGDRTDVLKKCVYNMYSDNTVACVMAPDPSILMECLRQLKHKDSLVVDWDQDYLLVSVSNKYNNIGNVLTSDEFDSHPDAYPQHMVVCAEAVDYQM